jgi:hypothetical protein
MGNARARKMIEDEQYQLCHERVAGIDVAKAKADVCARLPPQWDGGRRTSAVEEVPARVRGIEDLAATCASSRPSASTSPSTPPPKRQAISDQARRRKRHGPLKHVRGWLMILTVRASEPRGGGKTIRKYIPPTLEAGTAIRAIPQIRTALRS